MRYVPRRIPGRKDSVVSVVAALAVGAPGSQPTDIYPTNLNPTPDHSFDLDDIFSSPTP